MDIQLYYQLGPQLFFAANLALWLLPLLAVAFILIYIFKAHRVYLLLPVVASFALAGNSLQMVSKRILELELSNKKIAAQLGLTYTYLQGVKNEFGTYNMDERELKDHIESEISSAYPFEIDTRQDSFKITVHGDDQLVLSIDNQKNISNPFGQEIKSKNLLSELSKIKTIKITKKSPAKTNWRAEKRRNDRRTEKEIKRDLLQRFSNKRKLEKYDSFNARDDWKKGPASRVKFIKEVVAKVFSTKPRIEWEKIDNICIRKKCPKDYYITDPEITKNQKYEVHLVGTYKEGYQAQGDPIVVDIKSSEKPVILFLSSFKGVHWQVNVNKGVTVKEIWYGWGDKREQPSVNAPPGIPVHSIDEKFYASSFAPTGSGGGGVRAFEIIRSLTQLEPDSFQGNYSGYKFRIPFIRDIKLVGEIRQAYAEAQHKRKFNGSLGVFTVQEFGEIVSHGQTPLARDHGGKKIDAPSAYAYLPSIKKLYGMKGMGLFGEYDFEARRWKKIDGLKGFEKGGMISSMAFHPKSKKIMMVSGMRRMRFIFDPVKKEIVTVPKKNFREKNISALSYSESHNSMLAYDGSRIFSINENFEETKNFVFVLKKDMRTAIKTDIMRVTKDYIIFQDKTHKYMRRISSGVNMKIPHRHIINIKTGEYKISRID